MLLAETLAILMVVAVVVALMTGYPVALTLAGVSLIFAVIGNALGIMSFAILGFKTCRRRKDSRGIHALQAHDRIRRHPLQRLASAEERAHRSG
jgi:heme/copper-type cytochrome/quinol oxidase subunit 1